MPNPPKVRPRKAKDVNEISTKKIVQYREWKVIEYSITKSMQATITLERQPYIYVYGRDN